MSKLKEVFFKVRLHKLSRRIFLHTQLDRNQIYKKEATDNAEVLCIEEINRAVRFPDSTVDRILV